MLKSFQLTDDSRKHLADVYLNDRERIEKLRVILEEELERPISYADAQRIGTNLVELYKTLAQGKTVTYGGLKNKARLNEGTA